MTAVWGSISLILYHFSDRKTTTLIADNGIAFGNQVFAHGDGENKRRTFSFNALKPNLTAVPANDISNDKKTEPGPVSLNLQRVARPKKLTE